MKRYTRETKSCIITRCTSGETVPAVSKSTGIPRSTIYHWIKNPPLSKKEETAKKFAFSKIRLNGWKEL